MIYLVFYKTNDVFCAEEKLRESNINIDIVPTPVQDIAYCGICVKIALIDLSIANEVLSLMKYKIVK